MKLWFTESGRREVPQLQGALEALDQAAKSLGTTTETELQAQRSRWHEARARLPGLEEKSASLGRLLELTAKAFDGFTQEREREHDWLIRPRRARHRDSRDSGRDR